MMHLTTHLLQTSHLSSQVGTKTMATHKMDINLMVTNHISTCQMGINPQTTNRMDIHSISTNTVLNNQDIRKVFTLDTTLIPHLSTQTMSKMDTIRMGMLVIKVMLSLDYRTIIYPQDINIMYNLDTIKKGMYLVLSLIGMLFPQHSYK